MALRFEPDLSHAAWIAGSDIDWVQLCCFGPDGFESTVRLFHGDRDGLPDDDLESCEGDLSEPQLRALVEVLVRHTGTPGDCFFALWDGFGDLYGSPSSWTLSSSGGGAAAPPAFSPEVLDGPRLRIPARDYLLFRGALVDAGDWGAAEMWPGVPHRINSPNLMWPADRAWFVATEIDQPWTAVSGSAALIGDVVASGLDVEPVVPSPRPPYERST